MVKSGQLIIQLRPPDTFQQYGAVYFCYSLVTFAAKLRFYPGIIQHAVIFGNRLLINILQIIREMAVRDDLLYFRQFLFAEGNFVRFPVGHVNRKAYRLAGRDGFRALLRDGIIAQVKEIDPFPAAFRLLFYTER